MSEEDSRLKVLDRRYVFIKRKTSLYSLCVNLHVLDGRRKMQIAKVALYNKQMTLA